MDKTSGDANIPDSWKTVGGVDLSRKSKKTYVNKEEFKHRHEQSIENTKRMRKNRTGPNWWLLTPLAIAPVLPMIRIGLRHNPVLRDRVFKWTLGGAVLHGIMLISGIYSDEED